MPPELKGDIEKLIEKIDPESILLIASTDRALSTAGDRQVRRLGVDQALDDLAGSGYYDLGVFIDDDESLSRKTKAPLISGLRDVHSRRFLLAVPADAAGDHKHWNDSELIAFGLSELRHYENGWRLFEYNILNYKQTPDWLNPKHWANPERWGKYRW